MRKIVQLSNQTFQEFIYIAMRAECSQRNVVLTEETHHYIANIAHRYLNSDHLFQQDGQSRSVPTLAFLYRDALASNTAKEQRQLIQTLADTSLFLASCFPNILQRRGLDKRYFCAMGESAYDALAAMKVDFPCQELSKNFQTITVCLGAAIFPNRTQH